MPRITRSDSQVSRVVGRTRESAMLRCVQGRGYQQQLVWCPRNNWTCSVGGADPLVRSRPLVGFLRQPEISCVMPQKADEGVGRGPRGSAPLVNFRPDQLFLGHYTSSANVSFATWKPSRVEQCDCTLKDDQIGIRVGRTFSGVRLNFLGDGALGDVLDRTRLDMRTCRHSHPVLLEIAY